MKEGQAPFGVAGRTNCQGLQVPPELLNQMRDHESIESFTEDYQTDDEFVQELEAIRQRVGSSQKCERAGSGRLRRMKKMQKAMETISHLSQLTADLRVKQAERAKQADQNKQLRWRVICGLFLMLVLAVYYRDAIRRQFIDLCCEERIPNSGIWSLCTCPDDALTL